jgi:probable F420-dependent oxidoreductase
MSVQAGLMLPPSAPLADVPELARLVEERGFDYLACGEHVFFHTGTPNAFVVLAAAAAATRRIRLLSAVTVLPVYPAALAAKLCVTLDGVSGGRFDLGVGVGGEYPAEFAACGIPASERGARLDEALIILRQLFGGGEVTFAGRWATLDAQRISPPPVQAAGPPIWVGGRSAAAQRRAGRAGDVWLPYMVTPEHLRAGLATARDAARACGRAADAVAGAVYCWGAVHPDEDRARGIALAALEGIYRQDFSAQADRYLLAGTPEQVRRRLAEYVAAGATKVIFAPAAPPEDLPLMIETFASEVLPSLAAAGSPV